MTRPDPAPLTPVAQDYLKVVWAAGEWSTAPVTTKHLAERLGVGAPTVSETVRRLCDQGLLTHVPYGAVGLTAAGRAHAVAMALLRYFASLGLGVDAVVEVIRDGSAGGRVTVRLASGTVRLDAAATSAVWLVPAR